MKNTCRECYGALVFVAVVLWWSPSIALRAGALAAGRARFGLVMAIGDALAGLGCTAAACRVYRHEQARAGRRMAAMRARRGW